ncbi:MAG: hypothetical protein NZ551_10410 [Microscillaceae bacterium]|nr:hypothetical protein [Microscillaceae bacterium]MDW8461610.1 hypothetical protein [Cytophagales bacterium]
MPTLQAELSAIIVAKKLNEGAILYKEVWASISPALAVVYWFLYQFFEDNISAYQIIASLLVLWQALTFNQLLVNRRILQENTLIPALLYILLMNLFIDFYSLSAPLLANTFLLLAIKYIFLQLNEKRKNSTVFEIGVYLGIASLFYLPVILLVAVPILAFLIATSTPLRDYLIMFFSLLFTLFIVFLVFYVNGIEYHLYHSFFKSLFMFEFSWLVSWWQVFLLYLLSVFICVFLLFTPNKFNRYNNYQNRCSNVMFLWLFVSLAVPLLANNISPSSFMITIPALVFLLSHYFLDTKSKLLTELGFLMWAGSTFFLHYDFLYSLRQDFQHTPIIQANQLLVKSLTNPAITQNKRVLVIGDDLSYYQKASLATPYLDYNLSREHFENLDHYQTVVAVYENFRTDLPDVIIDQKQIMPQILEAVPLLAREYELLGASVKPRIYVKKFYQSKQQSSS